MAKTSVILITYRDIVNVVPQTHAVKATAKLSFITTAANIISVHLIQGVQSVVSTAADDTIVDTEVFIGRFRCGLGGDGTESASIVQSRLFKLRNEVSPYA